MYVGLVAGGPSRRVVGRTGFIPSEELSERVEMSRQSPKNDCRDRHESPFKVGFHLVRLTHMTRPPLEKKFRLASIWGRRGVDSGTLWGTGIHLDSGRIGASFPPVVDLVCWIFQPRSSSAKALQV